MGVLLTGMGRDGAAGLAAMHRAGGITIAQDEASCVVFGMPQEAIKRNVVDKILPPLEIADAIRSLALKRGAHDGF
jgi:two-component system chemotaxis response regulator CheB